MNFPPPINLELTTEQQFALAQLRTQLATVNPKDIPELADLVVSLQLQVFSYRNTIATLLKRG
jgi:hypothetical protein